MGVDRCILVHAFLRVCRAFQRRCFRINRNTPARIFHLFAGFCPVRYFGFWLWEHFQLAHDPEQTFWAADVTALAEPAPGLRHSRREIHSPHIPDELLLCLCVMVCMAVRASGPAGRGRTAILALFPEIDARPALIVFLPAGAAYSIFSRILQRDCRHCLSCVILLLMRTELFLGFVVCGNLIIPYEGFVLLLFYLLTLFLMSNMYCSATLSRYKNRISALFFYSYLL